MKLTSIYYAKSLMFPKRFTPDRGKTTTKMGASIAEPSIRICSSSEHTFLIGRDQEGHWVAVETHGLGGGWFRTREAAEHYAAFETANRPGAIQYVESGLQLSM